MTIHIKDYAVQQNITNISLINCFFFFYNILSNSNISYCIK